MSLSIEEIVAILGLAPHPEGGWYRQTFEDRADGQRAHSTAIYYLLGGGPAAAWHRVDAAEVWHWYAGAPLELSLSPDGATVERLTLGTDIAAGQRPQVVVPRGAWQQARCLGEWTLCGCTVAPGFEFAHFEMAAPGWEPGRAGPRPSTGSG
jgi:predicted cupin superfamily sugar epimerase